MGANLVSLDIETSGLDPKKHEIIEVGLCGLLRGKYFELEFSLDFDEAKADPKALEVNGWGKRDFAEAYSHLYAEVFLRGVLADAHVIAKNPHFDLSFVRELIGEEVWHHRTVDITALVYGWHYGQAKLQNKIDPNVGVAFEPPPSGERVREITGIKIAEGDIHTALGDARWNWEVFTMITGA